LDWKFKIKDLRNLTYFVAIEISRDEDGIYVNQRKYTLNILKDCGMLACKPSKLHMEQNVKQSKGRGEPLDVPASYWRLNRRLLVHTQSQFMDKPTMKHLSTAYKVLWYLKSSTRQSVFFSSKLDYQLKGFYDADNRLCIDTKRSIIGYY
jgi:hypothetical protein